MTLVLCGVLAAQASAAPSPEPVDGHLVAKTLLAVVAEKTGYPEEMLEMEMTLDADDYTVTFADIEDGEFNLRGCTS